MAAKPAARHRPWGTIEVEPLDSKQITGRTVVSPTLDVDCHRYVWRPFDEIAGDLPEDYCVSLNAISLRGASRRFYPDDPDRFVRNASLGGLSILSDVMKHNAEQRHAYHTMRLVYRF
jgi:hypothetical protein